MIVTSMLFNRSGGRNAQKAREQWEQIAISISRHDIESLLISFTAVFRIVDKLTTVWLEFLHLTCRLQNPGTTPTSGSTTVTSNKLASAEQSADRMCVNDNEKAQLDRCRGYEQCRRVGVLLQDPRRFLTLPVAVSGR